PLIVHVGVLKFEVRDRVRAETRKTLVLDHGTRTLRPAEINSAAGTSTAPVGGPTGVAPDEQEQRRLLPPRPASDARAYRRCHHSPPNCSRLNSSIRRNSSSSMVNAPS